MTRRPRNWAKTHGIRLLLAACAVLYVAGGLAYCLTGRGSTLFVNDGFQYYAYLPSLVLDCDLDFSNQYALGREHRWGGDNPPFTTVVPATGRPGNAWAIGPALLWLPFFLVGLGLEGLFGAHPVTGFSLWCQWPVYLGTLVYELLGLWLLYTRVLRDHGPWTRLAALAILLVATNLDYYLLFAGHMSHGLSFTALVLLLACLRRLQDRPTELLSYAATGAAVGLVFLVRWQDLVFALLPIALGTQLVLQHRGRALTGLAAGLLGFAPAVLVQALVWQSIYGQAFVMPQGSGWMVWGHPHLLEVVFSYPNGLLPTSPAIAFGAAGLVLLARRDGWWSVGSLLSLAAAVYVCAASTQWDAGESFGARRLVSALPLVALGLCELRGVLLRHPRPRLLMVETSAVVLWSLTCLGLFFAERILHP